MSSCRCVSDTVLQSLTLSHFRSHLAAGLRFDGRPVAIFGANGAGKTNILEAISLLSPGRGLRRAAPADFARRPESIGWKITAETMRHEVETSAEGDAPRQTRIDGKSTPQTALSRILRQVWLVPSMDRLWIEAAEGRRRFLDRMTMSFTPDHAEAVLAYEKAMRDRNRLLRDEVQDAAWYGALEQQMAETATTIHANREAALALLVAAQDDAFPHADLTITGHDEDLAAIWHGNRRRDMAAGRTLHGPHRADLEASYAAKSMPAAQCSTGEQKALLVSLILANARALPEPPVILLDEVAAHLDADRRAALYRQLIDLRAHTIMTGTGPELFADLGDAAQRFRVGPSVVEEG